MPDSSFILSIISTAIALVAFFMTRQDMNRRELKDQEMFIDNVYEQFQEQKLAMLQDPDMLEVLAQDSGKEPREVKQASVASIRINQAYRQFRLYENEFLSTEQWDQFEADVKLLYSLPSIQKRWREIQTYFQPSFQHYINDQVLAYSKPNNTKEMKLTVIHATSNCEASSCPTVYMNEKGNYIFQGFKVKGAIKSDHAVPSNEDMIELPKEFIQALIQKLER